ncbi:DUF6083 domain-containing protein [Streptomyces nogalater]
MTSTEAATTDRRTTWHGRRHAPPQPAHRPSLGRQPPPSPPRRSLQIATHSPSRLLRAGQTGRCRHCGNRIDWYPRSDGKPIALHPAEVPTTSVSAAGRWHLSSGVAYPHDDGSRWCRIPHAALCPHQPQDPHTASTPLATLRRELSLRTRRLIDTGAFTPETHPPATAGPDTTNGPPAPSSGSFSSTTSPKAPSTPSAASPRPSTETAAHTPCPPRPQDAGSCCPPSQPAVNSPCPIPAWRSTTSATCPTQTNYAGAPNAAPSTPLLPQPPTWPW